MKAACVGQSQVNRKLVVCARRLPVATSLVSPLKTLPCHDSPDNPLAHRCFSQRMHPAAPPLSPNPICRPLSPPLLTKKRIASLSTRLSACDTVRCLRRAAPHKTLG